MRKHWRAIAQIVKTHGKRGEVVTVPVHSLPSLIAEGMTVVPVPPALKGSRKLLVISVESDDREGSLVTFEGVTTISYAEELVGKTLLVEEDCLPENFGLVNTSLLMGREVIDVEHGSLGEITEVLVGPTQNVWVIDGSFGQVMMPAVDEFIVEAPVEGPITVSIPQGLLRLGE